MFCLQGSRLLQFHPNTIVKLQGEEISLLRAPVRILHKFPLPSSHFIFIGGLGHLVNITHLFTPTEPQAGVASNRNAKAALKKKKTTMLGHINLEAITRVEFIKAFLTIHSLHAHFAPGIHSGPEFRLSWTGSAYVGLFFCLITIHTHSYSLKWREGWCSNDSNRSKL